MSHPTQQERQAVIGGLRDLADFLETHPDVPVDGRHSFQYSVPAYTASHAEGCAEVDRVAALLGVTPTDDAHYAAEVAFGPVRYVAVAIRGAYLRRESAGRFARPAAAQPQTGAGRDGGAR